MVKLVDTARAVPPVPLHPPPPLLLPAPLYTPSSTSKAPLLRTKIKKNHPRQYKSKHQVPKIKIRPARRLQHDQASE